MIEALIIAGAIAASAILFYVTFRPREDIRIMARTLVRATEKRGEWDETINSEHIKRARVALVLLDKWSELDPEWVSIIIEEAVFDMEADRERQNSISSSTSGSISGLSDGYVGDTSGPDGSGDDWDNGYSGPGREGDTVVSTGWPRFETGHEDLEIPSSE